MKKLRKVLFSIFAVIILVSGCAARQYDVVKIDRDKGVYLKTTIAMDDELLENILKISSGDDSTNITDEMKWNYLDSVVEKYTDWNKEKYEQDGFKGYTITYKDKINLDDLSTTDDVDARYIYLSNNEVKDSHLFKKTNDTYKSIIKVQPPEEYEALYNSESQGSFEMTFTLILPNRAISNNADNISRDGKTLTWNVKEAKDIDVEFKVEKTNIFVYIIIVLIVIAFIVSLVFMIRRKK